MPRYIDANAIYDELSDIFIEYLATTSNTDTRNALDNLYHTVLTALDNAPTVSPDEVRGKGKWLHTSDEFGTYEKCSCCGKEYYCGPIAPFNYCPNCGARMEVSEDA